MRRSIQGMLEELEYNLWEHILQRLVDYGHAFSPEIEMAALVGDEAGLLHGEAVNIDMALTTQVSESNTCGVHFQGCHMLAQGLVLSRLPPQGNNSTMHGPT